MERGTKVLAGIIKENMQELLKRTLKLPKYK
jgi:hypothetical protein